MKMKYVYGIEFRKASRGWICHIGFRVETRRQFTMEDHAVRGHSPQMLRGYRHFVALRDAAGMLLAFADAYRAMRRETRWLQTLPGGYDLWKRPA
jgi:hypothetical protein